MVRDAHKQVTKASTIPSLNTRKCAKAGRGGKLYSVSRYLIGFRV